MTMQGLSSIPLSSSNRQTEQWLNVTFGSQNSARPLSPFRDTKLPPFSCKPAIRRAAG